MLKYHPGMSDEELVDWRRFMLRKARVFGYSGTNVAREIGTTYQNMQNLIQRASRRSEFADPFDQFLIAKVEARLETRKEAGVLAELSRALESTGRAIVNEGFSLSERLQYLLDQIDTLAHLRPKIADMLQGAKGKALGSGSKKPSRRS